MQRVIAQTCKDRELIIVVGCSTDETPQTLVRLLRKVARFRTIRHELTRKLPAAPIPCPRVRKMPTAPAPLPDMPANVTSGAGAVRNIIVETARGQETP